LPFNGELSHSSGAGCDTGISHTVNSIWTSYLPPFLRKKLDGRYHLQKVIGNTGWLVTDKILRMGVGLAVGISVARFLGPEQFGLFNYAVAFVSLFSVFATLGLDGIVVQELVHNPAHKDEILGTAFLLKFCGSGLTLLVAVSAILWLRPSDILTHWLVTIVAAGTVFQAFDAIDFWFQARVESKFSVYARSCAFLLVSATRIILIINHAPLLAFAWAASLEMILGAAGLVVAYRLRGQHVFAWRASAQRFRQLLQHAWPLALSGMAIMVYMKIDQVMLGEMVGSRAVVVYSAAIRISEVWYFIPISIVGSVYPSLIEARKASTAVYYQGLARLFRLVAAIALAIAIPMTFISGYVAKALYGTDYEGVGPILAVHIWAALFVFLGVAQGPSNIIEGLTKLALLRTFLGAVANVLLNLLLIPIYGAFGAAVATTVSYALSGVVLNAFSRRTRKIFALQLSSMMLIAPGKK